MDRAINIVEYLYEKANRTFSYIGCFCVSFILSCLGILGVFIFTGSNSSFGTLGSNLATVFAYNAVLIGLMFIIPYIVYSYKSPKQSIPTRAFAYMMLACLGTVASYTIFFTAYSFVTGEFPDPTLYLMLK